MNKLIKYFPAASALLLPALVLAQTPDTGYFRTLGTEVIDFINTILIPLVVALAVIVFLWGVFTYFILGASSEEKREVGRTYMLYGILGFVIIVALWGIVQIIVNLFGLTAGEPPLSLPDVSDTNN